MLLGRGSVWRWQGPDIWQLAEILYIMVPGALRLLMRPVDHETGILCEGPGGCSLRSKKFCQFSEKWIRKLALVSSQKTCDESKKKSEKVSFVYILWFVAKGGVSWGSRHPWAPLGSTYPIKSLLCPTQTTIQIHRSATAQGGLMQTRGATWTPQSWHGSPHFPCSLARKWEGEVIVWCLWVIEWNPAPCFEEQCGEPNNNSNNSNLRTVGENGQMTGLTLTMEIIRCLLDFSSSLYLLNRKVLFSFLLFPVSLIVRADNSPSWKDKNESWIKESRAPALTKYNSITPFSNYFWERDSFIL